MVLGGELEPGQRLNEVALAESLGISRGPLREAIQRLAAEGLLRVVTHKGAYVPTFDRQQLTDLYELRTTLESAAIRLGTERASDQALADLRAQLERAGELVAQGGAFPNDVDLHARFVSLAGNEHFAVVTRDVHGQITLARARSGSDPERAQQAHAEHLAILDRMEARQPAEAAALMEKHLDAARDSALERLTHKT
ncbi:hypothetical protein ASG73_01490 [Janibacter sp. Soil728]|nr:hypothetical protein ASG73_01490 [Janibacter sp. Soil728]